MLVDINLEAAEETKRLIDEEGGDSFTFKADVSRSSDCQDIVETCLRSYGRVDVLDNNVGISVKGGIIETSEEDWDRIIAVNLKSVFLTCKYVLPHMEKQGSGCIINISSIAAIRMQPIALTAYAASKAGMIALTREVAIQYAAKGIRANVILPGLMKTPRIALGAFKEFHDAGADELWRKRDAMCPTGKQGDAWDTAYAALFLASNEAKYITGTTLIVDGGITGTMRGW